MDLFVRRLYIVLKFQQLPDEMSHSAPHPHALESDSDQSLSPKMMSEDEIVREVSLHSLEL